MQYNILINQGKAIEWGLNLQQAAVFSFIFNIPTWAQHVDIDGVRHYHIRKSKIASEIPVITNKPDTVYRIMRTLAEKGIISMTTDGRRTLVAITELGASWNTDANLSDDDISQYHQSKRPQARAPKSDPRLAVMQRDGYQCQACGKEMNPDLLGKTGNDCPEIDHIIPRSRGGSDSLDNLQCLCGFCNRSKGAMTMEEYTEKNPTSEKYPLKGGRKSGVTSEKSPTDQDTSNQDTSNQSLVPSADAEVTAGSRAQRKLVQEKTSTDKPKERITKPSEFKRFFETYPDHRKGGTDKTAWSAWKSEKLTAKDALEALSWLETASMNDPETWGKEAQGRYCTGIVTFIRDRKWKTPIPIRAEQKRGQPATAYAPSLPDFNFED